MTLQFIDHERRSTLIDTILRFIVKVMEYREYLEICINESTQSFTIIMQYKIKFGENI